MICTECGKEITNADGAKYCPECGIRHLIDQSKCSTKKYSKDTKTVLVSLSILVVICIAFVAKLGIDMYIDRNTYKLSWIFNEMCDSFAEKYGYYPSSVEELNNSEFKVHIINGAVIKYSRLNNKEYTAILYHNRGSRVFMLSSKEPRKLSRSKSDPEDSFR